MTENKILLSDINLVRMNKPELILDRNKQVPAPPNRKVGSLNSGDDVTLPKKLECVDVLNLIVPLKEWEENGKYYRQSISNQLATKMEVEKLSENLDKYLKQFNAKEVGICPIKRELYTQCFNEAIRLTTLNCVKRGRMMVKIRDEINTTIDGYQKLFESVTALRIRKAILREQKRIDQMEKADRLRAENETLEKELAKTLAQTEEVEKDMVQTRQMLIERHAKEISDVKKAHEVVKDQILSIIAPKKSNRP